MEDRRILIILLVLLVLAAPVFAYSNANNGGHPVINKFAVQYYKEKILPSDPLLFTTSLNGGASQGLTWDESDGDQRTGARNMVSRPAGKLIDQWIEDGGYSADEPEYTMALVHFFDPANPSQAYLTDLKWLQKFGELWDSEFVNPHLSAVDWANDRDRGSGYFIQDYSWDDALKYYQAGLASISRENNNYGRAWRAVGETMHLVSDMTIPAHVRNDGHAWSDPYEDSVGSPEVYHYAGGKPLNLDYSKGSMADLMTRIATYTNQHFYSADTLPYDTGSGLTYAYPLPSLEQLNPDDDGYYTLEHVALARKYPCVIGWDNPRYLYVIDEKVLNDQQEVLIPTAVRGSAEVLDRFLPRFDSSLSVVKYLPDDPGDDQYVVHATLVPVTSATSTWRDYPGGLIVRNGAYLVEIFPDGRQSETLLWLTPAWGPAPADPNFNDWSDLFKFTPGTRVSMKYDLGGYVVRSNEITIPWPTPTKRQPATTPTTRPPATGGTTPPWGCVNTATCTPEHPENCCPGTSFEPCKGCEKCCYWSDAVNPVTGQKPMGFVIDAFCSCATGVSQLKT